ncbi:MAG: hypothetical protein ACXABY_27670 [Candidatus Thorarchaeota archaeon]
MSQDFEKFKIYDERHLIPGDEKGYDPNFDADLAGEVVDLDELSPNRNEET